MNYAAVVPGIDGSIQLQLGGLSVTCVDFRTSSYVRQPIEVASLQYSAAGSSVSTGPLYPWKFVWEIDAAFTVAEEVLALDQIYTKFQDTRPHPNVLVVDRNRPLIEDTPRSRGIASGGSEWSLPASQIAYPALFNAHFVGKLRIDERDYSWAAQFILQETDRVLP